MIDQIHIKILEHHVITNSSYQNLKIFLSKMEKKASQIWMIVSKKAIPKL